MKTINRKSILITGSTGFLGKKIIPMLQTVFNFIVYPFNERLSIPLEDLIIRYNGFKFDYIFHLAGPSTSQDFQNMTHDQIREDIIEGTKKFIELAKQHDAKLIFFSSEAIFFPGDVYGDAKLECHKLIIDSGIDYKIYVIPRVYCKTREKGLIQKLKLEQVPLEDYNNKIQYLDILDFLQQFKFNFLTNEKIIYFDHLVTSTIKEIKNRYISYELNK